MWILVLPWGYKRFLSRGQVGKETPRFWRCKLVFSALVPSSEKGPHDKVPVPASLCRVQVSNGPCTGCPSPAQGHSSNSVPAPAASVLSFC